ncbi:hypothetical protein CR513_03645, partial [Mucuna pruriens]
MEEWMQQMNEGNMQFQQNLTATTQDLKIQVGQLANTISQMQSNGSGNIPFSTILNLKGGVSDNYYNSLHHNQIRDQSVSSPNWKLTPECSSRLESSHYPNLPGQSWQGDLRLMRTC